MFRVQATDAAPGRPLPRRLGRSRAITLGRGTRKYDDTRWGLSGYPPRERGGGQGDEQQEKLAGETADGTPIFGTEEITLVGPPGNGNNGSNGCP